MNNMIRAFMVVCLTIASTFVYAQQDAKLSGQVLDANNKPADVATVALVRASDSVVVKTALADANGKFLFERLKKGEYRIWVAMMGHKKYKSSTIVFGNQDLNLPLITLVQAGAMLKEVSITGQKSFVERKIDRTVVNVDALISNAGTTAMDVLESSPGVYVDQNGTINLKGKQGVTIFIDDKPTYLSGADLQNYLRSLPSSTLNQIEIMTNPPAKYDAAGGGGVINIKTKRNKISGFNGSLNLSYNQGQYARTNNSLNLTYRNNKFNLFGNFSYAKQNNFNDLDLYRKYMNPDASTKSFFNQNSYIRRKGDGYNAKIGMDFYQNEKTTWGIVLSGQTRPSNESTNNVSKLLNPQSVLDSVIKALNTEKGSFKNGGINLNYRHQFDKSGKEITVDLDHIAYKTNTDQLFDNSSYFANGTLKSQDQLIGRLPADIGIYSAKVDYTHPLKGDMKFSAGLKSSYTKTDNLADYDYTIGAITKPDYGKSNHFIYKETINAAYANLSKDYKKLSIQLGLRVEQTTSNGHQLGNIMKPDSAFKRSYTDFFPTVYLSYKLDSAANNQFGLNYGRRINRPYYQDLNPFISPLDKFTYYVGNPFLKPAFTHNIELSHTYKNKLTTTLSYSRTNDDVGETIEILNGTYYSRPGNLGSTVVKSISIDGSVEPVKWFTFYLYTELTNIHTKSDFYTGQLDTKGTFWLAKPNAQFKFGKDWVAEIGAFYRTRLTSAQFTIGAIGRVNAGLQKKLSSSTTLKFNVNDIFYTGINNGIINNLALTEASWRNKGDSRQFVLSLSYRFGKTIKNQRKHDGNGAESEQSRVKN